MNSLHPSFQPVFKPAALMLSLREALSAWPGTRRHTAPLDDAPVQGGWRRRRAASRARREAVKFEPIEPRLLLNADLGFDMAAGSHHDITVRLADVEGVQTIQIIDNAGQGVLAQRGAAEVGAVRIDGSTAADRVVVDLHTDLGMAVSFSDATAGDGDTLEVLAPASLWTLTGPGAGTVSGAGAIDFSGVENLQGDVDNFDTFEFEGSGSVSGVVDGGAGGNDSLALVSGVFDLVTFTAVDPETGTIARDADLITFRGLEPATDSTPGAKAVADIFGSSRITISGFGPMVTVGGDTFPETFVFTDPDSLTVDAGSGADRITVLPGLTIPLTVSAGAALETDDDIVVLSVPILPDTFDLGGGGGEDSIVFASTAAVVLTDTEGGLFRSIDNAETFDDIVALADGTVDPFPKGSVDDIERDPADPARAYAAVARRGVFFSDDSGASWTKVSDDLGEMQFARRIMLAVSPSVDGTNHPLYAAIVARAQRLTAVANANALAFQVSGSTVLQAGDEITISGSQDGIDNDSANGIDDEGEAALDEKWKIATVGAIVNGIRTITLSAANADQVDNDGDATSIPAPRLRARTRAFSGSGNRER